VNTGLIDGLIIMSATIGNFVDTQKLNDFQNRFSAIPTVTLGTESPHATAILVDNKFGMRELMRHLIVDHGYKKIAFIQGTPGNNEAEERYAVYKRMLQEHRIPYNPKLVSPGDFTMGAGTRAVALLVDKRKMKFDALAATNDLMAIEVIDALRKRNISVPQTTAVTGFDDIDEGAYIRPPLTTVGQPLYRAGVTAVDTVLSLIKGEGPDQSIVLATTMKIRRSCGCYKHTAVPLFIINSGSKEQTAAAEGKTKILRYITGQLDLINVQNDTAEWASRMYSTLLGDLSGKTEEDFIILLDDLCKKPRNREITLLEWWDFLSGVFNRLVSQPNRTFNSDRIKKLYGKALETVWEDIETRKFNRTLETENLLRFLHRISIELITSFNTNLIKNRIVRELPQINIKQCYIFRYSHSGPESVKPFFGYSGLSKPMQIKFESGHKPFPSSEFIQSLRKQSHTRFAFLIMALFFKTEQLGFIVFDMADLEGIIYETLAVQISAALKGALLIEKIQNYSKKLESDIRARTKELVIKNEELKKLDTMKNDFIANITHDFRSPLTAILNTVDLSLKFNTNLEPEHKKNYKIVYEASLRLRHSIDKLLDLAKMDAQGIQLDKTIIDIVSFLNSIINYFSSLLVNTNIKISNKIASVKNRFIYTDKDKLEEAIGNIISNAIKFTDQKKGIIEIGLRQEADSLLIAIGDNGVGIPHDKLSVIFDRFVQLHQGRDDIHGGTGIGLAYAKQLIGYLQGDIWAESAGMGKGAKFYIKLPLHKIAAEGKPAGGQQTDKVIQPSRKIKKLLDITLQNKMKKNSLWLSCENLNTENEFDYKKGKILIIDDDENVSQIIKKYLEHSGYTNFLVTNSGKLGLNAVYENAPDIIICDYNIPDKKGNEIHDEIAVNPRFRHIPFIFLSAIADKKIIIERREKGASSYLKKPIDEQDLVLTVNLHLQKYYEYLKTLWLASMDELTGVFNRRQLLKRLTEELAVRKYRDMAVIFIDLDHLKEINDNYGHLCGDEILKETGSLFRATLREYDIPGRYGGDEFVIILPDTNIKQALHVAQMLQQQIAAGILQCSNSEIKSTLSIGISSLRDNKSYIKRKLGITSLKQVFDIKNPRKTDWKKIKVLKQKIADTLLEMADNALRRAKLIQCGVCGFFSEKEHVFVNGLCPKCGSRELTPGRNKICLFKTDSPVG
jgi:diguanylate cyclase (GGDEF)-like protein